tara:strand:+ start:342 stop:731 length:390 start_codon:yes stop_codon:yes gene_type:complete
MAYNDHRASDYNQHEIDGDYLPFFQANLKELTSLTDTDQEFQFVIQVENGWGETGTTRFYGVKLHYVQEHEEFYFWTAGKEFVMDQAVEDYGNYHNVKKSDVRIFERVGNRMMERLADRTGPHLVYGKN